MPSYDKIQHMIQLINRAPSPSHLEVVMEEITAALGFQYYAIAYHAGVSASAAHASRLHNYPASWVGMYDEHAIAGRDPVRRACRVTNVGFPWQKITSLIDMTDADHRTLKLGRDYGIGDGFTVPANVPGELSGSCTFVGGTGRRPTPEDYFPTAQLVGAFAFNCARKFWLVSQAKKRAPARLTDRQRECVIWVARGKSDWEISRILGVSEETVTRHVKAARDRYEVQKRTLLAVRALADGTISFDDVVSL